jgi:hypothetical protein
VPVGGEDVVRELWARWFAPAEDDQGSGDGDGDGGSDAAGGREPGKA